MQRIQSRLRRSRRTQYRPHQLGKSKEAENGRNKRRRNLGMDMPKKQLVAEALIDLHRRLSTLAARSHERRMIMQETANLYGVSEQSLYRALAQRARPRALRRSDRGAPRVLPQDKMEYYCELIAAIKVRTSNKKGRHLSTAEAIRLIEEFGVETPDGLIKAQKSMFKTTTVNRYLRQWGYDHETLRRQPAAGRFQAEHSNDCWQFDLSPSDLKEIKEPLWLQPSKGAPTLMLFSVVDDRSGVAYQEYRCVYGEDVEAGLRFLFNAMAPKQIDGFLFQGIPKMIYTSITVRLPGATCFNKSRVTWTLMCVLTCHRARMADE